MGRFFFILWVCSFLCRGSCIWAVPEHPRNTRGLPYRIIPLAPLSFYPSISPYHFIPLIPPITLFTLYQHELPGSLLGWTWARGGFGLIAGGSELSSTAYSDKICVFGTHPRIHRIVPDQVSGAAARDLPSTRAGGQDDVSSKQTPSTCHGP